LANIEDEEERRVLEQGIHALLRFKECTRLAQDPSVITSLDVIIHWDRKLGLGGFAEVYVGTWQNTAVAVKVLEGVPPQVNNFYARDLLPLAHHQLRSFSEK
jgi:hypothetical protein